MVILLFLACLTLRAAPYEIELVAGGVSGGDNSPALSVRLLSVEGLATDTSGNVYIADTAAHKVFKVDTRGTISKLADVPSPYGLATDAIGSVYVADFDEGRVLCIYASGGVETIVQGLAGPRDVAVDPSGALFIADYAGGFVYRIGPGGDIRKVATPGLISPAGLTVDSRGALYVADPGAKVVWRYSGVSATAIVTHLSIPTDLAFDARGSLYIADSGLSRVRVRLPDGREAVAGPAARAVAFDPMRGQALGAIRGSVWLLDAFGRPEAFAGAASGQPVEGMPALEALLEAPMGVAVDRTGRLYIAEQAAHRVRRIQLDGRIEVIAGIGEPGLAGDGGQSVLANLSDPVAVAVDPDGEMRIAEYSVNRIRGVDRNGIAFTALAAAQPRGLAFDASGVLYVADTGNDRVLRVARNGSIDVIGAGVLHTPCAVAVDREGRLIIADSGHHRVLRMPAGGAFETIADELNFPTGAAGAPDGAIWIADTFHHRVLRVDPYGTVEIAVAQGLNAPASVAVDNTGTVYVADLGNNRVVRLAARDAPSENAGTLRKKRRSGR